MEKKDGGGNGKTEGRGRKEIGGKDGGGREVGRDREM